MGISAKQMTRLEILDEVNSMRSILGQVAKVLQTTIEAELKLAEEVKVIEEDLSQSVIKTDLDDLQRTKRAQHKFKLLKGLYFFDKKFDAKVFKWCKRYSEKSDAQVAE